MSKNPPVTPQRTVPVIVLLFSAQTSNALGVKRRLAATETHIDTSPPTARCPLQLLVGLPAYRCGLTKVAPRALWSLQEVTPTASSLLRLRVPWSAALVGVGLGP